MGVPTITVVGNLTADQDLRFTPNGVAVAKFTVAATDRTLDKATNEWKDGDSLFLYCSVWREAAECAAESLTKGMRVIVVGRLKQRSYEKDGQKRTVYEMTVDEVAPSLKYATARVNKMARGSSASGQSGSSGDDPWASAAPASGGKARGGFDEDEPPF